MPHAGGPRTGELGLPSDRAAVIVRTTLPPGLERLRRRYASDAIAGVPAHITMLYPFAPPGRLGPAVRCRLASIAAATRPFDYRLQGSATWPDVVYVAVDPIAPFVELQRRLTAEFPDFPIYGADAGFDFVPHVTITGGLAQRDAAVLDPAWTALPRPARAAAIEVIARPTDAPWRLVWRVPLGRMPG